MCGSILTLVQGEKKWRIISPFKKVMYFTTQKEGETIFIPPGFRHEVYTVSSSSIAYGSMWTISEEQQYKLICLNREFLRTMESILKKSFEEDYAHFSRLPNESQMNSILQKAGQEFAIQKGGSTNRIADGRKRKKTHLKMKKHSRRK